MTPKSLLRHPMTQSRFEEISPGTRFKAVYPDETAKPESVQKVLFCSGKVYYELLVERKNRSLEDAVAIVRIEQICPFPYHLVGQEAAKYRQSKVV